MRESETKVKDYLKSLSKPTGEINIPLSQIAEDTNLSIATVHRAIKKLEGNQFIRVTRSHVRSRPDTIMFLGDPDDVFPAALDLLEKSRSVIILSSELVRRLVAKQKEIDELKHKLKDYENKETMMLCEK